MKISISTMAILMVNKRWSNERGSLWIVVNPYENRRSLSCQFIVTESGYPKHKECIVCLFLDLHPQKVLTKSLSCFSPGVKNVGFSEKGKPEFYHRRRGRQYTCHFCPSSTFSSVVVGVEEVKCFLCFRKSFRHNKRESLKVNTEYPVGSPST